MCRLWQSSRRYRLLQNAQSPTNRAAGRLGAVTGHLLETKIIVDPQSRKVNSEFFWAGGDSSSTQSNFHAGSNETSTSQPTSSNTKAEPPKDEPKKESAPGSSGGHVPEAKKAEPSKAKTEEGGAKKKEYTAEEVMHAPPPLAVILVDLPESPLKLSSGSVTESIQWLSSPSSMITASLASRLDK